MLAVGCGDQSGAAPATTPPRPAPLAVTGATSTPIEVGPPIGHTLTGVDRDAGLSVALRDGSTLWLFGDTAARRSDESLRYFIVGTAAWAPPGRPAETHDHDAGGRPLPFLTPTADFPSCPGDKPVAGLWPSSAVVQHVGERDRVVIWLENVCLGDGGGVQGMGMAVAEWWYDPAAPPDGQPVQGTVLNSVLFPRRGFGMTSVLDGADRAFVYACAPAGQEGEAATDGQCQVGRVELDHVADPDAYDVWDGSVWGSISTSKAARLSLPTEEGSSAFAASGLSVAFDPGLGKYVMAYTPWPGYSNEIEVRVADQPVGPWSSPTHVPLPHCEDERNGVHHYCYAATTQPLFSSPGSLALGYYDRLVSPDPPRGAYLVITVPVDTDRE